MLMPADTPDIPTISEALVKKTIKPLKYFIEIDDLKYVVCRQYNRWVVRSQAKQDKESKAEESCFLDILVVTGLTEDYILKAHAVHKKRKRHFHDRDGSLDNG